MSQIGISHNTKYAIKDGIPKSIHIHIFAVYNIVYILKLLSLGNASINNITKVIFGQEVSNGTGFSYLVGESIDTVYPGGVKFSLPQMLLLVMLNIYLRCASR